MPAMSDDYPCARCGKGVVYGPAAPEGGLLCNDCVAIQATTDDDTEPPTDADLARIERCLPERDTFNVSGLGAVEGENPASFGTDDVRALVDEVRRLRSDEWLADALRAIRESKGPRPPISLEEMLDVFRKYRDGQP
jgi:hypothetical protein